MKEFFKKLSEVCKLIFGYGIMIVLFAGGTTFFGYVAALFIGGDTAALICKFISESIFPIIIYASTCLVILGIIGMYMAGEMALTPSKREKK